MNPDGKPFFAATCVPRGNAYGRMGMLELVPRIGELWKSRTTTDAATATCCTGGFSNPWGTTSRSTSPAWVRPGARS